MAEMRSHIDGTLETIKHAKRREKYYENLPKILELGHEKEDLLHYFGAFVGDLTLIRAMSLIDAYKQTKHICGHISEIGVYRGASSILFAKLIRIYEQDSLTMCHGFDNFMGTKAVNENPLQVNGGNITSEMQLRELIRLQELDNILKIHKLDAEKDFPEFFDKNPHLRFRLVFVDSGTYEVVSESIKNFWPRMLTGGIMIFDQFNCEVAPGETRAICEFLPNEKIETFSPAWMPNAFVRKL